MCICTQIVQRFDLMVVQRFHPETRIFVSCAVYTHREMVHLYVSSVLYREIVLEGFVFNNVYIDAEIVVNCSQCQGEEGVKEGIDI